MRKQGHAGHGACDGSLRKQIGPGRGERTRGVARNARKRLNQPRCTMNQTATPEETQRLRSNTALASGGDRARRSHQKAGNASGTDKTQPRTHFAGDTHNRRARVTMPHPSEDARHTKPRNMQMGIARRTRDEKQHTNDHHTRAAQTFKSTPHAKVRTGWSRISPARNQM